MQMGRLGDSPFSMACERRYIFIDLDFILENNIDFVCHDDVPYTTADVDDAYAIAKRMGRFKATTRTEGVSTTDVVTKILKNKEMYYKRNIKRGKSREELGMGFVEYWMLRAKMMMCPDRMAKFKSG